METKIEKVPKILLAFAAAYDSAIGSVQPSAATISSSKILRTFSILVSILSPLLILIRYIL